MQRLGDYIKEYSARNKLDEEIPVYSVTNSNGFCRDYFGKEVASNNKRTYKIVPRNAFAYNPSRINVGSVDYQHYEDRVIVSPLYNVFTVDEKILPQYLYFYLKSPNTMKRIRTVASGSVRDNLKLSMLCEFPIQVPSINRQQDIIELLEKAQRIIDEKNDELEKLDNLIKARFAEMFGLPGTDPFEYGKVKLGECCEINPKKAKDTLLADEIEVSFVSMPSVSEKGEIDPSDIRKYEVVKKGFTYFAENDVLFAKITPCMENGKGAVAKGLMNGIGFGSTEFHVLRPIEGLSNSYWIYVITSFKTFRRDAKANMTGSAGQRRTPASFLESYEVSLPPIELQNQFAAFVAQVDKSKFAVQKSLEKTKLLFDSLMQEYFG